MPPVAASSASAAASSHTATIAKALASSPAASETDLSTVFELFTPDAFANGFATLIGALAGAMLAYLLQRRFQSRQERSAAQLSAHRLMFVLLQQLNTIVLIQRDYVYPELGNRGRFIAIPAMRQFDTSKNVLELTELSFLLDDSASRQLLYDFYIAQENYLEALNQWNLRSSFHLEQLQPALARSGIINGGLVTDEAIRKALGDHVYFHAINATDNCILSLQRAFEKLVPFKNGIRAYVVKRFKTNDFTEFEFPETWGLKLEPVKAE